MKKKNAKKWMALFLALAMVVTSGVLTTAPGLLASEENTYETAQDQSQDTAGTTGETADAQEQTSQEAQLPEDQTIQSSDASSQASGQSDGQPLTRQLPPKQQRQRSLQCRLSHSAAQHLTA